MKKIILAILVLFFLGCDKKSHYISNAIQACESTGVNHRVCSCMINLALKDVSEKELDNEELIMEKINNLKKEEVAKCMR